MTKEITIEEIVRLDSERTRGSWQQYERKGCDDAIFIESDNCECTDICVIDPSVIAIDLDVMSHNAAFIAAAPRIADKAIALGKVNKELVEALKEIMSNKFSVLSEESATCMKIIAIEVLTKTGAL